MTAENTTRDILLRRTAESTLLFVAKRYEADPTRPSRDMHSVKHVCYG